MNDFDPEKAKAVTLLDAAEALIVALHDDECSRDDRWRAIDQLSALAIQERAALSRRPAGDVGKLVEGIYAQVQAGGVFSTDYEAERYLALSDLACQAADALTALSSAPVEVGVEELAKFADDWIGYLKRRGLHASAEFVEKLLVTLRTLSRQLTTESQAWAKVRAEIEAEVGGPDLSRSDGLRKALAILAQHTPQEG